MTPPALVCLTQKGADTARLLLPLWENAQIYGRTGRVEDAHAWFQRSGELLPALFARKRPIIAFCAAGIVIRALAPILSEKGAESPVLAVSEDGKHIVPLLGAHRGALLLAQDIAARLGGTVAATGGGETRFGVMLDAPPAGWRLANTGDYAAFIAELLQCESVALRCAEGETPPDWLTQSRLPWQENARLSIHISIREQAGDARRLVYHPQVLLLGIGCERDTDAEEIANLVRETLQRHGLAQQAIAALASVNIKANEPALLRLAESMALPLRLFSAARLEQETPRLPNPSDIVYREVGCHGVAEAAALAAAGADGTLLVGKSKSARATCAIARAPLPVNAELVGRGRGSLAIVGLGPGDAACRSLEADMALAAASDIIGYRLYLRFLAPLSQGKRLHGFELGQERTRARRALQLASEGRHVALVSSGDAGIYGMASPLLEEMEKGGYRGFSLRIVPGISALQMASARAGAVLGHDFAAVSLSDLLTPWESIETRLQAALQGDFVLALYNPVSKRRRHRLERALELLRAHREADVPVVVARNLGREGEATRILSLGDLCAEDIDMMTILLVGCSRTRHIGGANGEWAYTPRGYEGGR